MILRVKFKTQEITKSCYNTSTALCTYYNRYKMRFLIQNSVSLTFTYPLPPKLSQKY